MQPTAIEKKIVSKLSKTIKKHHLIEPNDRILVGLSGGKDSLVLTKLLSHIRKHMPFSFLIDAIFIDLKEVDYRSDTHYLKTFCEHHGVTFLHHTVSSGINVENPHKNICFLCSQSRRTHLFDYVKDKKYTKLALGHHLDDAIETLLMNMMYHANISALPARLSMFDGQVTLIRPMIEIKESLIVDYAKTCHFQSLIKTCPYERDSSRQFVRDLLQQMENRYDRVKNNIFASMNNIDEEYLP